MTHLISVEAKQVIIKKVLSGTYKMAEVALANNISRTTLHNWIKRFKSESNESSPKGSPNTSETPAERFKHLQATFGQEDVMVGAYCRKNGLYPHQLAQWETDFMTNTPSSKHQKASSELKAAHAEVKSLKRIILRKDKVLAETIALLVLKKKAAQIWGDNEED